MHEICYIWQHIAGQTDYYKIGYKNEVCFNKFWKSGYRPACPFNILGSVRYRRSPLAHEPSSMCRHSWERGDRAGTLREALCGTGMQGVWVVEYWV